MQKVAKIKNFKYPEERFDVVWIFDQSSNHRAYAKDALLAHKMNVHPGPGIIQDEEFTYSCKWNT